MEQPGEQQGVLLLLWGPAVDWLPGFSRDKGAVDEKVVALDTGLSLLLSLGNLSPHGITCGSLIRVVIRPVELKEETN